MKTALITLLMEGVLNQIKAVDSLIESTKKEALKLELRRVKGRLFKSYKALQAIRAKLSESDAPKMKQEED